MKDETGRKVKYWRLEPVYENDNPEMFVTAAVVHCMVTGEMLDGMGGGGYFMSNYAFKNLNTPEPKVVISAAEYDRINN